MVRRDRTKLDLATRVRRFRVGTASADREMADPIADPNVG